MDKNLNLADYWTKSPPLIFAVIIMVVILIGAILGIESDHAEPESIIGTSIGIEERTRDGEKVILLLVELDSGSEILLTLPNRKTAHVGARVKMTKKKSGYPGSTNYNHEFKSYAN